MEDEPFARRARGGRAPARRGAGAALRDQHDRPLAAATLERLRGLGFRIDADELITPATLAVRHCVERGHRRVALVMNDAVKEDFAELDEGDERRRGGDRRRSRRALRLLASSTAPSGS